MPIQWKTQTQDGVGTYRWLAGGDPLLTEEEANTGRQDTLLVARLNGEFVGKFQSGLYGKHAEEGLLEELRKLWGDLLAEGVVWRPTSSKPVNVLSIHLTRSPCGDGRGLHNCARQLIDFVQEMNRKKDGTRYNRWGVNWNLRIRIKFRRIYGQSLDEKRQSKDALKELWAAGIALRAWDMKGKAGKTLTKNNKPHALARVQASYFNNAERNDILFTTPMKEKLDDEKDEAETFLRDNDVAADWSPAKLGTLKDVSLEQDIHSFIMLDLYQETMNQVRQALETFAAEYADKRLRWVPFQSNKFMFSPEHALEYAEYLENMESDIDKHWRKLGAEYLKRELK